MLKSRRNCVHSKANLPLLSSILIVAVLCSGCAFGRLGTGDQKRIVDQDVPGILQPWLLREDALGAATGVPARVRRLRSQGWFVEEFQSPTGTTYGDWYSRYSGRQYLIDMPEDVLKKPEFGNDFLSSAMVDQWHCWSAAFAQRFSETKADLSRLPKEAVGEYFRIISPKADRVYDVIAIRPADPDRALMGSRVAESGIEDLWRSINPPKSDEFPGCMFKDVRFVEPEAAKRFVIGKYTILEAYARRYYPSGTFLHASYGKSRGRDTYILALLSSKAFIIVQTVLYPDTTRETLVGDLRYLIGNEEAATEIIWTL
jgi:hypothetical protein